MACDASILRTIERAAVRGWPALETELIGGWLARASSGGSTRANTVSALDWEGGDLDAAIERVTTFYRARRALPRFNITGVSVPAGLDVELAKRGWQRHGDHVTMAKAVMSQAPLTAGIEVGCAEAPSTGWYGVYLQGLTENRRAVAPRIVERVPAPRMFFSAVRDGDVIASGLSVLDGEVASVQCMATLAAARRSGAARAVLSAIEAFAMRGGAKWLYLQAEADNTPAIGLYTSVGFEVVGHYHTRELER